MPRKAPRPASMDEIRISRDREYAVIDYADEAIGGMQLHVGPEIANMSDQDILALHNAVVAAMRAWFIPAGAGNRRKYGMPLGVAAVHPHGRGERAQRIPWAKGLFYALRYIGLNQGWTVGKRQSIRNFSSRLNAFFAVNDDTTRAVPDTCGI